MARNKDQEKHLGFFSGQKRTRLGLPIRPWGHLHHYIPFCPQPQTPSPTTVTPQFYSLTSNRGRSTWTAGFPQALHRIYIFLYFSCYIWQLVCCHQHCSEPAQYFHCHKLPAQSKHSKSGSYVVFGWGRCPRMMTSHWKEDIEQLEEPLNYLVQCQKAKTIYNRVVWLSNKYQITKFISEKNKTMSTRKELGDKLFISFCSFLSSRSTLLSI